MSVLPPPLPSPRVPAGAAAREGSGSGGAGGNEGVPSRAHPQREVRRVRLQGPHRTDHEQVSRGHTLSCGSKYDD